MIWHNAGKVIAFVLFLELKLQTEFKNSVIFLFLEEGSMDIMFKEFACVFQPGD